MPPSAPAPPSARAAAFVVLDRDTRSIVRGSFGSDERAAREFDALSDHVYAFAFPEKRARDDASTSTSTSTSVGGRRVERFTFCLTREDGTRIMGAVRRVGGTRALATLGQDPWFEYHARALEGAETEALRVLEETMSTSTAPSTRVLTREDALWVYLDRVLGSGAPKAGETVAVGLPWTAFAGVATQSVTLRAPDLKKEFNLGIKFTSLLDVGHVDAVLALFTALVTERRVVIAGSRLEALSGAVQAANATLYPLSWQHIFLPILPESLLDYLTAPMPFLIGLHSSLLPEMRKLPCDDIFLLNLDDGSYTYFEEDFDNMPGGPLTLLRVGLLRELERTRGQDSQAVARVFRTFFSSVLGPYKQHIKGVVANPPPKDAIIAESLWLDQEEFMRSKHGNVLFAMRGTQMYEVFVRQRLAMCANVARKTGFVPVGDEIVDFDLEEPDLTFSDLMMRGQAMSAQFASASSHAFSVGSTVFRQTMQKAKHAYSSSKTIQDMRKAFSAKKAQFTASMSKLREKSSEDLYANWAEYEGSAKTLNFGADANGNPPPPQPAAVAPAPPPVVEAPSQTPQQPTPFVPPPAEETVGVVSKPELTIPDAREERVPDENVPPSSETTSETRVVTDRMRLMSFGDDHDGDANTGKPTGPPPERSVVEPIPNLIDL